MGYRAEEDENLGDIECPNCGTRVYDEVIVCPNCGLHFYPDELNALYTPDTDTQPTTLSFAAVLAGWVASAVVAFAISQLALAGNPAARRPEALGSEALRHHLSMALPSYNLAANPAAASRCPVDGTGGSGGTTQHYGIKLVELQTQTEFGVAYIINPIAASAG